MSTYVPVFQIFSGLLHNFELTKYTTSSVSVKAVNVHLVNCIIYSSQYNRHIQTYTTTDCGTGRVLVYHV